MNEWREGTGDTSHWTRWLPPQPEAASTDRSQTRGEPVRGNWKLLVWACDLTEGRIYVHNEAALHSSGVRDVRQTGDSGWRVSLSDLKRQRHCRCVLALPHFWKLNSTVLTFTFHRCEWTWDLHSKHHFTWVESSWEPGRGRSTDQWHSGTSRPVTVQSHNSNSWNAAVNPSHTHDVSRRWRRRYLSDPGEKGSDYRWFPMDRVPNTVPFWHSEQREREREAGAFSF